MVETLQTTSGVDFPEITKEVLDLQQNVREQKPQTKETQENKEEITYANLNEHLNKRANEITQEIEQKGNPLPEEEKMKRNLKILEVSNESKSAFEVNSWGGSIGIEFVNRFGYSPDSFPDTLIPRTPEQTESIFIHHKVGTENTGGFQLRRLKNEKLEDFSKRAIRLANIINKGLFVAFSSRNFNQFYVNKANKEAELMISYEDTTNHAWTWKNTRVWIDTYSYIASQILTNGGELDNSGKWVYAKGTRNPMDELMDFMNEERTVRSGKQIKKFKY